MNWVGKILAAFGRGLGDLSPNCKAASRLQSEALDHPLPLRQRMGLRVHLVLCKWCRRYGKQIGFLREVAHESDQRDLHAPRGLSAEAKERMKQKLNEK
jgi:hypothetical protein